MIYWIFFLIEEGLKSQFDLAEIIEFIENDYDDLKIIFKRLRDNQKELDEILRSQVKSDNLLKRFKTLEQAIIKDKISINQNLNQINIYSKSNKSISDNFFKNIKINEGIIKYYFGELDGVTFGNVILITRGNIKSFFLGDVSSVLSDIKTYNKILSENLQFDLILSQNIYKSLFQPIIPELNKINKLIFIQGNLLENLAFHTLLIKIKESEKNK